MAVTQVENTAPVSAPSGTSVSSGTASEAMIKAAEAASSAATPPTGATVGDTLPPAGDGTTPVTTAAAIVQPVAADPAAPVAAATRGEAPEPRIVAATRNARAEVEARYEWAKDLNPQQVANETALVAEMRRDPRAFVERLSRELGLAPAPVTPPAEVKPPFKMPDPALRSEDGKGAYTAEQVQAILQNMKDELLGVVKPLQDERAQERQANTLRERMETGKAKIDRALAEAQKLPHFEENKEAIKEQILKIPYQTRMDLGAIACLHMAYNHVLATKVFPGIQTAAETKVRDENARKAASSSGTVRPTGTSGDGNTKASPQNPSQLAARMAEMEASGQFG